MKIAGIETYPVRIPLTPSHRMATSLGQHLVSDYLLVRVRTDDGIKGAGEATVSPLWSGETIWSAQAVIERLFAPAVAGCDPRETEEIDRRLDRACQHNWFAKAAVEMACWDIAGKAAGKPVFELLGGAKRPLAVRSRFSMSAFEPDHAARRARELVAEGFTTIKVKVGRGGPDADIARVRAAIGPDAALTIDANCGWDVDTAIACVNALEDCNLALVEQPTPDGDYAGLARVRRATKPPVMADDICFNMAHARELIRNECCDVISLYPGKNGGIGKAMAIAEFAAARGVACTIGSNLELDIGTAAMAHLVIGCANMQVEKFPGDMIGPSYHQFPVVKNPISIAGPITTITDRPGLGVEPDWDVIRAHRRE